jgi:hypothetical protein
LNLLKCRKEFEGKPFVWLLLSIAIALSVFSHSMIWKEWYYPTYGNTNIHVATAEHILTHWEYPLQNDYSYGGGLPSLYVPGYRLVLAGTIAIVGSADLAQRLLVMLFSLLLPIGFFLFARQLFGDYAGIAAAFFASLPVELLIYTVRPLPQAMGLVLLPFAFYAIAAGRKKLAIALSLAIALTHQEAAVFLAAGVFAYAFVDTAAAWFKERKFSLPKGIAWISLLCWAATVLAYVGWHYLVMGDFNIFGLAQFQNHEGNVVLFNDFVSKTGWVLSVLGILGIVLLASKNTFKPSRQELLLLVLGIIGFAFVKNELVGIKVFMDRFIVFLQIPLVVLAAYSLKELCDYALQLTHHTLFPKTSE